MRATRRCRSTTGLAPPAPPPQATIPCAHDKSTSPKRYDVSLSQSQIRAPVAHSTQRKTQVNFIVLLSPSRAFPSAVSAASPRGSLTQPQPLKRRSAPPASCATMGSRGFKGVKKHCPTSQCRDRSQRGRKRRECEAAVCPDLSGRRSPPSPPRLRHADSAPASAVACDTRSPIPEQAAKRLRGRDEETVGSQIARVEGSCDPVPTCERAHSGLMYSQKHGTSLRAARDRTSRAIAKNRAATRVAG